MLMHRHFRKVILFQPKTQAKLQRHGRVFPMKKPTCGRIKPLLGRPSSRSALLRAAWKIRREHRNTDSHTSSSGKSLRSLALATCRNAPSDFVLSFGVYVTPRVFARARRGALLLEGKQHSIPVCVC